MLCFIQKRSGVRDDDHRLLRNHKCLRLRRGKLLVVICYKTLIKKKNFTFLAMVKLLLALISSMRIGKSRPVKQLNYGKKELPKNKRSSPVPK